MMYIHSNNEIDKKINVSKIANDISTMDDTAIHPSVYLSPRRAAALSYRHAGCLQLSHVRTADPFADGRRSVISRTAIGGGGHIVSLPPGR